MKKIIVLAAIFQSAIVFAQQDTSYWSNGGVTSLTFNQVSLSNWAAGGDNSVSLNAFVNVFANYKKDRTIWENNLVMGYGLIRQGSDDTNADWQKTDDKINLISKFGYKLSSSDKNLYWSTLLDFRTQFQEGIDAEGNVISEFMAPGYLLIATGLDYIPNDEFSLSYSPVTGKITFVMDDSLSARGAFGVDANKNVRSELGSFLKMSWKKQIVENVDYETRVELFTNYAENAGNIDVNWENVIVMKVNKFLSVNFINQLLYDDDIDLIETNPETGLEENKGPQIQYKNVFGVGLTYKFGAGK